MGANNKNIIEKAIAEAIAANNAKRDKERNALIESKMAIVETSRITELSRRVVNREDERTKSQETPKGETTGEASHQISISRRGSQAGPSGSARQETEMRVPSMTFNNSARTGNRIPEIPQSRKHPEILEDDIEKPNKFLNTQQEKEWELSDCKRRIIIRVERADFIEYIEDKDHVLSDDLIFKNPVNYEARVTGVKVKIFNATGIPPHRQDIIKVSISIKRAKLAWVPFTKTKSVNDIFRLAVINGNSSGFNAFPHVPAKAMKRRDAIE